MGLGWATEAVQTHVLLLVDDQSVCVVMKSSAALQASQAHEDFPKLEFCTKGQLRKSQT
jgi:hypothetical protein